MPGILGGKKETGIKIGKYNKSSLSSWVFLIMFDNWSKIHNMLSEAILTCRGNI